MPRIFHLRIFHLVWIIGLVAYAGVAAAGTLDDATIAAVDTAATVLTAMGKDSFKPGNKPPRQSDPAVKSLIDTVFDTGGLMALAPIAFPDLDKLNDWSLKVVGVGSVYVFAGSGIADPSQLRDIDDKLQQRLERNTVDYAPEMGRYLDSSMQVTQALVTAVMTEMALKPTEFKNPQVQTGLARIRSGLKQTLNGVVTSLLTPGLDPAWIRGRLPPLNAIGPTAAKFLLQADRKEVADIANQVAAALSDAAVKQGLADFVKTLGI